MDGTCPAGHDVGLVDSATRSGEIRSGIPHAVVHNRFPYPPARPQPRRRHHRLHDCGTSFTSVTTDAENRRAADIAGIPATLR